MNKKKSARSPYWENTWEESQAPSWGAPSTSWRRYYEPPPSLKALDLRRVNDPPFYAEPPEWYLIVKLREYGSDISEHRYINLTRDVASMSIGGEIKQETQFLDEVLRASEALAGLSLSSARKEGWGDLGSFIDYERRSFIDAQMGAWGFVSSVDLSKVCVGDTPVERAIAYLASLGNIEKMAQSISQNQNSEQDFLPGLFSGGEMAGRKVAEALNKAWENVGASLGKHSQGKHSKGEPSRGWDLSNARNLIDLIAVECNNEFSRLWIEFRDTWKPRARPGWSTKSASRKTPRGI